MASGFTLKFYFLAALQELGLQSVDDSYGESLDKTAIVKAAEKVVDEYVKLSLPDLEDTAKIRFVHQSPFTVGATAIKTSSSNTIKSGSKKLLILSSAWSDLMYNIQT